MLICKHCSKECKNENSLRNHERTCPSNMNRVYKNGMLGKKGSNQFSKARRLGMPVPVNSSKGKPGRPISEEQKALQSRIAKERKFGGYRANAGRSKKFKVVDSFGKETILQSSYELECSEILNRLGINWLRPKALKYDGRNYFADFYLPDYDIWLDPKNSYKAKIDKEKIDKVIAQNGVKLYVLLKENLTEEYIKQLCS